MRIQRTSKSSKHQDFDFPAPMYFVAKFFHEFPRIANALHSIEFHLLQKKLKKTTIDRPIYITGLARSGTTITLEMLSQHPDVASHRYLHMVIPYIPHWVDLIANQTHLMTKPVERFHKDGMLVTRDSREAVEEIFWQRFFKNIQNEGSSNILDAQTRNQQFECFYRDHIKKLLFNQDASRYLAKNNNVVARFEYVQKLFPDAKFLIFIRNPFNHIASFIKQNRIISELGYQDPRLLNWNHIIGHREFGTTRHCINLNDSTVVQKIRRLWKQRDTYITGWAVYWASMYSHVHEKLQENRKLSEASLIVRYEDLCKSPGKIITEMINHMEIDAEKFTEIKDYYCSHLNEPTYYKFKYSEKEQENITQATGDIAGKFDYVL